MENQPLFFPCEIIFREEIHHLLSYIPVASGIKIRILMLASIYWLRRLAYLPEVKHVDPPQTISGK